MNQWDKASYVSLVVLQAVATQLAIEIGAGRVPLPPAWHWVLPVASAGLVTLSMLLPRMGART